MDDELAELRRENEILITRCEWLEDKLRQFDVPSEWHLTATERLLVGTLRRAQGKMVSKADLHGAIWCDARRPACVGADVRVHLYRIRKKLKGYGIRIHTFNCLGYSLYEDRLNG